jgi:hypothetical protein
MIFWCDGMRLKVLNKKNLDSHHEESIAHCTFRPSLKDISKIIENSPNLRAIQFPTCGIQCLTPKKKELLDAENIIILEGNQRNGKLNWDGCVVIPEERIIWDQKFLKMSDEALCEKYLINIELLHYIFSKYSSHDIFICNTKLFLVYNKIILVAI